MAKISLFENKVVFLRLRIRYSSLFDDKLIVLTQNAHSIEISY